jgi:hypothetical protein
MTFPLYPGLLGYEAHLIMGTLIGVAFGFVLERSGFGQAPVLAAQFYGSDTRVLKVMFSAIVTAMLGMTVLSGLGLLDMGALVIPRTYLWPQLLGGFLLGIGFIVSGYCPGTSVVSAVSGNKDGMMTIVGVMAGALVFGWVYPAMEAFYVSGDMGVLRMSDLLGLPDGILAAGVAAMAAGAFLFGELAERFFGKRRGEEPPASDPVFRNKVFAGFAVVAVAGLATLAIPARTQDSAPSRVIANVDTMTMASMLVESPDSLWIVDLRSPEACLARRVPGATCRSVDDPDASFIAGLPDTRTLMLYGDGDLDAVPEAALRFKGSLARLAGGFDAFERLVLTAPEPPEDPTPAALADFKVRSALNSHFTGVKVQAPPPAARPAIRREAPGRKGGGC